MQDFTSQQILIHTNAEPRPESGNPAIMTCFDGNSGSKALNDKQVSFIIALLILCIDNNIHL